MRSPTEREQRERKETKRTPAVCRDRGGKRRTNTGAKKQKQRSHKGGKVITRRKDNEVKKPETF